MNIKKITSMAAALCICLAMAGCGDTEGGTVNERERPNGTTTAAQTEAAAETTEAAETTAADETAAVSEEAPSETSEAEEVPAVNAAEQEIINADLRSGYVKIDNDLFRNGGYYTVRSLYEEYSDRYDIFVTDEQMESRPGDYFDIGIRSKTDPAIYFEAQCVSEYNKAQTVGDCIVTSFDAMDSNTEDRMMYPGGLTFRDNNMTEEEVLSLIQSYGMAEAPVTSDYFIYDGYEYKEPTENIPPYYYFHIRGSEQNLLGEYPVFGFKFIIGGESGKIEFGPWGTDCNEIEGKWRSANDG